MTEKQNTFGEFVKNYSFVIPDYQRAYSWGEKQLNPFINDILEHCDDNDDVSDDTTYYLGHYILENSKESDKFEIVDGQQRISTVYLFLLVCGYLKSENYINEISFKPVSYDLLGLEEIKAILSKKIDVDDKLEKLLKTSKTSSLKRMIEAVSLFKKAFSDTEKSKNTNILNAEDIGKYIEIINKAYCSVAIFNDKSVASQIFELHNTRGVKLTETEKVKALLMKNIYIHSSTPLDAEINIQEIQNDFSRIFEFEEKANEVWLRGEMSLDTILMYHLRAIEDGNKIVDFGSPNWVEGERGSFEYIKESLSKKNKGEIVAYAKKIAREFARSMEIITYEIPLADEKNPLVGDSLLLDKNRSMIFLLRAFRSGNPTENKLIERWENFLLCYEIIYWNGYYYNAKAYRDDFQSIYQSIKVDSNLNECNNLLLQYYKKEKWFSDRWEHLGNNAKNLFEIEKNKWHTNAYGWDKTAYFLYKFEIENEGKHEDIRKNIFKKNSVSIDHIVARGVTWEDLGFKRDTTENIKQSDELWKKITSVINGVGNLSLSTSSANSSDSNGLPYQHLSSFEDFGLVKTVELIKDWKNPNDFATNISQRTENIRTFINEKIINRNDIWE
ncbi:DUF262 domain-containing protein [Flavobacterium soyangense]|uniref:DUF262 domain-containing protein n=1 Tax=Flavobacterium soyangense TaxID=2023265 RepID=A0A930UA50_9FLAO|nr:DUF262 domain-containing protein [Flavobacterium soyangense]MBF2709753.1 DUF262 domain-containing protein [Flavobacterium soyangense]